MITAIVLIDCEADSIHVMAGRISKVDGVINTDSHIAFRAYSQHDLDAAFAIGLRESD